MNTAVEKRCHGIHHALSVCCMAIIAWLTLGILGRADVFDRICSFLIRHLVRSGVTSVFHVVGHDYICYSEWKEIDRELKRAF